MVFIIAVSHVLCVYIATVNHIYCVVHCVMWLWVGGCFGCGATGRCSSSWGEPGQAGGVVALIYDAQPSTIVLIKQSALVQAVVLTHAMNRLLKLGVGKLINNLLTCSQGDMLFIDPTTSMEKPTQCSERLLSSRHSVVKAGVALFRECSVHSSGSCLQCTL